MRTKTSFRNEFIECRLGQLTKNSVNVDAMVEKRKWFQEVKSCSNQECRRENSKSFRKCRSYGDSLISCEFELSKEECATESIYDLGETVPPIPTKKGDIVCGEPNMVNPNSYETISNVTRSLGHRAGKSKQSFIIYN